MADYLPNNSLESNNSVRAVQGLLGNDAGLIPFEGDWHVRSCVQADKTQIRQDYANVYKPTVFGQNEAELHIRQDASGAHFIYFDNNPQPQRLVPIAQNGQNLAGVSFSFRKPDGAQEQKSMIIQKDAQGHISGVQQCLIRDAYGTRAHIVYAFEGTPGQPSLGQSPYQSMVNPAYSALPQALNGQRRLYQGYGHMSMPQMQGANNYYQRQIPYQSPTRQMNAALPNQWETSPSLVPQPGSGGSTMDLLNGL